MEVIAITEVLRRHVILIVALTIIATLAGYGISFVSVLIPEKYMASATILVRPHSPMRVGQSSAGKEFLDFPVAQTPVVESASKTYIQIIQTPTLIGEVVRELKLDQKTKTEVVADTWFARTYEWVKATSADVVSNLKDAIAIFKYGKLLKEDPFTKAVNDVSKGLVLKSYEDTYVFEIEFGADDPKIAADVANTTARLFIELMQGIGSSEARASADRLKDVLEQSRQRLAEARENLQSYKTTHGIFLYQSEYDEKLRVMSDLTVELAKLDATYASESAAGGTIDSDIYAKKRERLVHALADNKADLATLPTLERELQLRQTDVEIADATYQTVAKEMKDAEMKASDTMPEARLISPALPPQLPTKPRRDIITLAALLSGLLVGVALAFFLEYIDRTARGIHDFEVFVGLKVIGTIPRAPREALALVRNLEHFHNDPA